MYKLTVAATTTKMLKQKLFEFAEAIEGDDADESDSQLDNLSFPAHPLQEPTGREAIDYSKWKQSKNPVAEAIIAQDAAKLMSAPTHFPATQTVSIADTLPKRAAFPVNLTNEAQPSHVVANLNDDNCDARGVPWSIQAHSSSKEKNTDGSWRKRRGVDTATVSLIEEKLMAQKRAGATSQPNPGLGFQNSNPVSPSIPSHQVAAPAVAFAAPPLPVTDTPVTPPQFQTPAAAAPQQAIPTAAAAPSYENIAIPQVATKPAHTSETFRANLVACMADLAKTGKITPEYIQQINAHFKVAGIWEIANSEGQSRELFDVLTGSGLVTRVG